MGEPCGVVETSGPAARCKRTKKSQASVWPEVKPIVDLWGASHWALAGGPRGMGALLLASTCAPRELPDTSFAIGWAKDLTRHHVLHLHATVYIKSDGRRTTETSHPTATTSITSIMLPYSVECATSPLQHSFSFDLESGEPGGGPPSLAYPLHGDKRPRIVPCQWTPF